MKVLRLQRHNSRHELGRREARQPLADVLEVPGIERECRATAALPDTMAITKTRERAFVPVLDDAYPWVTERLTVDGLKGWTELICVGPRWRLPIVAGIFKAGCPLLVARCLAHGVLPR